VIGCLQSLCKPPSTAGLAAFLALALAQEVLGGDATVFRNVAVFDGSAKIPRTDVTIEGGRITRVGPDQPLPPGAKVVEGAGKTLLPGLIDCHVHAFFPDHLKQAAVFGVTTELDMFTDHKFAAAMRSEQKAGGALARADLLSAGTLATAPGGHGTEYGMTIPTITEPRQAAQFVADRLAEGSDYIKIVYDDAHEIGLSWPSIDRATLAAVIHAAHAHKKLAVVHVLARENALQALEEGVDGLVHIFIDHAVDDPLVKLAAQKKAFVIPTLTVLEGLGGLPGGASLVDDPALAAFLLPADRRALKSAFTRGGGSDPARRGIPAEVVRKLKAAGVPILAGTDAINPGTAHGASIHRELELLVLAGLSPAEALAAATSVPASIFGLADRGRIAEGLRADLVLVAGDPCTQIKATRAIVGVWKEGQPIDRESRRAAVRRELETLAEAKKVPPPKGSEEGVVSDFEGEKPSARFGSGWSVSTDALIGGKSKAAMAIAPEGSAGSKGSLKVSGNVEGQTQSRWAGVMFSPGPSPMAPANLSAKKAISFWAKGDGKPASVMLFFQANGFIPAQKPFQTGKDWKQFRFPLADFNGCDGSGLLGVFFGGSIEPGPFSFQIDEVRFE
jgi:imidazolonepropionase-like amidohydrolase